MRRVSYCQAECGTCSHEFARPFLGDFAYGDFILTTTCGTSFAYLDAIDNPAWKRIDELSRLIGRGRSFELAEVCARLADPLEGARLTVAQVCPACRSRDLKTWGGEVVRMVEIAPATFGEFLAEDPERQKQLVDAAVDCGAR